MDVEEGREGSQVDPYPACMPDRVRHYSAEVRARHSLRQRGLFCSNGERHDATCEHPPRSDNASVLPHGRVFPTLCAFGGPS